MKKNYIKILTLSIALLFVFILSGCKLPIPNFMRKTTNDLPVENYDRSTLDNIDAYDDAYTYKDVLKMMTGKDGYMPSVGNVKVLVIPIKFSNIYTNKTTLEKYHEDIERAFFGTDTGYESLATYYEKSSYGKLKISGEVLPWYTPVKESTYYENIYLNSSSNPSITNTLGDLAIEVLNQYKDTIDFSEYDYDKDGILDGVYLVCNKNEQNHGSLYWSWVTYYGGKNKVEDYKLYQFMWSTISFIYTDDFYRSVRGNGVNAISFIHETGHMFGIDDFYDYSANEYKENIFGNKKLTKSGEGCNLGAGSFDMMDSNVGDHNANTKMMLGWISPYVITRDAEIVLNTFSSSGDAIIVAPSFSTDVGNLSEYFVIEYYDHNGLADQNIYDTRGYTESGIRIYHVNSQVVYDGSYWSLFKYDNSYTSHAYITLVDAKSNLKGKTDFIDSAFAATDESLFQEGDTFIPIDCSEYVNKLLTRINIKIEDVNSKTAKISITFND